jgi:hypothetical protein
MNQTTLWTIIANYSLHRCFATIAAATILVQVALQQNAAAQPFHAAVLIDRSSSMLASTDRNNDGIPDCSRCEDAVDFAWQRIDILPHGTLVAVWTFNASGYIEQTNGFVSRFDAQKQVDNLRTESCTDTTPMAMTVCDAIIVLSRAVADPLRRQIWVYTDGGENTSSGVCAGTRDTDGEPWEVDTWQGRVWQQLFPDDTTPYDLASLVGLPTVVVHYGVFENYITIARLLAGTGTPAVDPELGAPTTMAAAQDQSDTSFFESTATASGGYVTHIDDQGAMPAANPYDVDGDGCVDQNDVIRVLDHYEETVPPAPASVDVNYDFFVDYGDYSLVSLHYGSGCQASTF